MTKQKLIILLAAVLAFAGGAFYLIRGQTPTQKVEDLKANITNQRESSGYNECLKQVKEQEAQEKKCVTDKLVTKGYTDGIDCIQDYTNETCKNTTRYNAEVEASNECGAVAPSASPKLTEFDCAKLLQEK